MTDRGVEDFWDSAPSGHVIADLDGRIIRANATLARWLGHEPDTLCGRVFSDFLTVGGRILYDTHFGPLLHLGGDLNGVTVDVETADGTRLPMFLTANVTSGSGDTPELVQITVVDAANRRAYEVELLEARQQAETEQGRVRVFAETLRRALLPLCSPLRTAWMPPITSSRRRSTMSAAISMTSFRCRARHGASSSVTLRARASRLPW